MKELAFSEVNDARKYDIEKRIKPRRKMSSKHAILDYEKEDSAKYVNGENQITEHNPLLKRKCVTIEETKGVSIALKILKTLENVKFLKQFSSWLTQEALIY